VNFSEELSASLKQGTLQELSLLRIAVSRTVFMFRIPAERQKLPVKKWPKLPRAGWNGTDRQFVSNNRLRQVIFPHENPDPVL
jgi:hypothetical protein